VIRLERNEVIVFLNIRSFGRFPILQQVCALLSFIYFVTQEIIKKFSSEENYNIITVIVHVQRNRR